MKNFRLIKVLVIAIITIVIGFLIFKDNYTVKAMILFGSIVFGLFFTFRIVKDELNAEALKNIEYEEARILEIKEKYYNYIDIVDKIVKETLETYDKETQFKYKFEIKTDINYLISFEEKLKDVSENYIYEEPDTFIVAACLMVGLINHKRIKFEILENMVIEDVIINYKIAFNTAIYLLSELTTYYKDDNGNFIKKEHDKLNIVVPDGLIENSKLYNRILNTISINNIYGKEENILEFSHLLHLIYLNNIKVN